MNKFINNPTLAPEKPKAQMELFAPAELQGDELQRMNKLAGDLDSIDTDIQALEGKLKELKQEKKKISEFDLPEIMNAVGMSDFSLKDGKKVKLTTFYDAKLKDKSEAFAYIEKQGDTSIIKDTIAVNFDRGQFETANHLAEELSCQGYTFSRKEDIHHSTLKAYVKEKIESGSDIPFEAFGIYVGSRVTIK